MSSVNQFSRVEIIETAKEWKAMRQALGGTVGFVPTMGALHEGHLKLVEQSQAENDFTLVSIFVNPTQFNDPKDFDSYPQNLERDVDLLSNMVTGDSAEVFVFAPTASEMYPRSFQFRVDENKLSLDLEGSHRPGHFSGMLTVVMKLLNIAGADRAYFGEKDFQQLRLVREMVSDFFMSTKVIGVKTIREVSGLAMSSRNQKLNSEQLKQAVGFSKTLRKLQPVEKTKEELEKLGFAVDYVADWEGRRLGAVRLGGVRLIDNFSQEELL